MKPRMESNTPPPVVIGIDIGKEVFHLVGSGADERAFCCVPWDTTRGSSRRSTLNRS